MAYTPPAKGYAPGGVTYGILHALHQKTAAKPTRTAGRSQPSEAELAVRAQLAPLYAALDAQETARQKQEGDAQRYAQQQTLAYMQSLQAQAPQQLADYQNAAGQTASIAGRAADLLKSSSPDAQIQAGLKAIGAPEAQQQQIGQQNQADFGGAGASLFTSMGSVPGASLEAQGLAASNLLRGLSASVAATGQQNLAARQSDSAAARAKYQSDRAAITGRTPELLQTYNQAAAGNYYKQQQLDLEKATILRQQGYTQAQIGHMMNEDKLSAGRLAVAGQNANTAATAAGNRQANADRNYNLALRQVGISQAKLRLSAIGAENKLKSGGYTPQQLQKLRAGAVAQVEDDYHGVAPKTRYDTKTRTFVPIPGTGKPPIPYYQAIKKLVLSGLPPSIAGEIVNSYYAPGEGGRPRTRGQKTTGNLGW